LPEEVGGLKREDAMVFGYADRISVSGGFPYTAVTVVLHPTKNETHFHLVYATRLLKGVEVFKDAERRALRLSKSIIADAKRRAREHEPTERIFLWDRLARD
jgi:hypothetical protein